MAGHYPPCEDKIDYCQQLGSDACTNNQYAGFVRLNCRKTCDKCTGRLRYQVGQHPTYDNKNIKWVYIEQITILNMIIYRL